MWWVVDADIACLQSRRPPAPTILKGSNVVSNLPCSPVFFVCVCVQMNILVLVKFLCRTIPVLHLCDVLLCVGTRTLCVQVMRTSTAVTLKSCVRPNSLPFLFGCVCALVVLGVLPLSHLLVVASCVYFFLRIWRCHHLEPIDAIPEAGVLCNCLSPLIPLATICGGVTGINWRWEILFSCFGLFLHVLCACCCVRRFCL